MSTTLLTDLARALPAFTWDPGTCDTEAIGSDVQGMVRLEVMTTPSVTGWLWIGPTDGGRRIDAESLDDLAKKVRAFLVKLAQALLQACSHPPRLVEGGGR